MYLKTVGVFISRYRLLLLAHQSISISMSRQISARIDPALRRDHCMTRAGNIILVWGGRGPEGYCAPACNLLTLTEPTDSGSSRVFESCLFLIGA